MTQEAVSQETRVTAEVSLTAKGTCQWAVKSSFPTVKDALENLGALIKGVKEEIAQEGYREAGM